MLTRTTLALSLITAAIALAPACSLFKGGNDRDDVDPDSSEIRDGDDAPIFLDFGVSSTQIDETDTLTFTAVLTDPDGIDTLIGGSLKAPGGATYGAFQTAASEGAYSIALQWDDLNSVQRIDLESGENERTFEAEFFDEDGHRTSRSVTVSLECAGGDLRTTCGDGLCVSLETNDDCGECGNSCGYDTLPNPDISVPIRLLGTSPATCVRGGDGCWGQYRIDAPVSSYPQATCDEICGDWTCLTAYDYGDDQVSCSAELQTFPYSSCLCQQAL